jgi:undecaprenyl-diphosphatase
MDLLRSWDERLLIWLNGFHTDWLDPVMYLITKTQFWIPLFAYLIWLIFRTYRKESWYILAGIALMIILSDQITSSLMKPFFARLRPSHDPALKGILHLVNGYEGGLYGFASSHAADTFATACFIWYLFRTKYPAMILIFLWAALMMYTRIYLGVHYPGDILAGMIIGLLSAWVGFKFYLWLKHRWPLHQPTV